MSLLTESNTKTQKGVAAGYRTFILHLAPAQTSGYQTCPMSTASCRSYCLNTAGRGRFTATQTARIRKTRQYFEDRPAFLATLSTEIAAAVRSCAKSGHTPCVRLNGTSDIRWERHRDVLMDAYPGVQFYDYTKLPGRDNLPPNYSLTFSLSDENETTAFAEGLNVAAIFFGPFPETFMGRPVVDGDRDDLRFLDPAGCVVGLHPKGSLRLHVLPTGSN